MELHLDEHPNQSPETNTVAPLPMQGIGGLEARVNPRNAYLISLAKHEDKSIVSITMSKSSLVHVRQIIPLVLLKLMIVALASECTSLNVNQFLVEVLS